MVSGDTKESENEEEEELLKQAIALSLELPIERAVQNDNEEVSNNEKDEQQEDGEEEEEELMLRQAIALSLEGAEEEDD